MSLKFWNKYATIECIEIEHMMLGTEFTIEDGRITSVISKEGVMNEQNRPHRDKV